MLKADFGEKDMLIIRTTQVPRKDVHITPPINNLSTNKISIPSVLSPHIHTHSGTVARRSRAINLFYNHDVVRHTCVSSQSFSVVHMNLGHKYHWCRFSVSILEWECVASAVTSSQRYLRCLLQRPAWHMTLQLN